jgi:flavin reductase (DIM6/NTAB) family NADH-FMN oxidoreductase RutF
MFYRTAENDHGLPRNPFKAIVAPRPIGWITSMSAQGSINLAPYSFFNAVSDEPPIVLFSSEGPKDSLTFIIETGEFVCSLATYDLRAAVVETSGEFPRGVNEMKEAGLAPAPSRLVRPPRVAASPCALECKLLQIIALEDLDRAPTDRHVVFGQVIGIHIDDRYIKNGRLNTAAMRPIARCGYADYASVDEVFSIARPPVVRGSVRSEWPGAGRRGLLLRSCPRGVVSGACVSAPGDAARHRTDTGWYRSSRQCRFGSLGIAGMCGRYRSQPRYHGCRIRKGTMAPTGRQRESRQAPVRSIQARSSAVWSSQISRRIC